MDKATIVAFLGVAVALVGVAATLLVGLLNLRSERRERDAERETIRKAVDAEIERVLEIVAQQLKWIEEDSRDAMNWLPIHTPTWDALAPKVGALEPDRVRQVARFFGYVAWTNDVLRLGDPRDPHRPYKTPGEFTAAYRTALKAARKEAPT